MTNFFFYFCTVHSNICSVHSPINALFYFKKHIKIYIKIHINIASICFGLRQSSGEPALNLAKVIFMLKHSVKLCRYLLCGCVAACHWWRVCCMLCHTTS